MMKCARQKAQGSRGGGGDAGVHTRLAHGAKWGGRVVALSDPITKHRPLLPWDQSAVEHWHSILPRSKYEQSKIAILHPSFCDMLILIWTVNSTAVQTKSGLVVPKWRYHPTITVEHDLSTNLVMSFQKRQCHTLLWNDITQYLTGAPVPILVLVVSLMVVNHPIKSIGLQWRISLMKTTVLVVKNKNYSHPISKSNILL